MEEEILDVFIKRIEQEVITDEKMTAIPLAYLLTRNIPDSLKHFFDQEVELWIREEEEKFTSNDRFDYDMPEVRMLIDQIFDRLKQNATFSLTKFRQLLERAIKLEMNYVIEPHRTLTQFLFKDNTRVSTMEVYDTLKYFFRYDYYKKAISDYFNMKYLREVTQDQFKDLINQIDKKAFDENPLETTLKTVKTIMEFLGEVVEKEVNTLAVSTLYTALKDRNLDDYAQLAKRVMEETDIQEMNFEEIEKLLRDEIMPGVKEAEIKEPTEVIGYDKIENLEESKPEVALEDIELQESIEIEAEEEVEEEEEEFEEEEELEEEEKVEAAEAKPSTVDSTEEERAVEEAPVSGRVADELADYVASQISSASPLQDLHGMIKGRVRRKSIKKLFKKNEKDFVAFIDRLNTLSNWKDASHLIDEEFYERGINPYSKEAIALSDIIYLRFFPKDKYVGADDAIDKF